MKLILLKQYFNSEESFFGKNWILACMNYDWAIAPSKVLENKWKLIFKYYRSILNFSSNIQIWIFVRHYDFRASVAGWHQEARHEAKQQMSLTVLQKKNILLQSIRICWFTKQFVGLKSPFISCQTDRYQCHWQFQSKNCSKTNWSKAMAFCSFVQDTEQKCWKAEMQILSVKIVNLLLLSMPFKRTHWLIWKLQIKPLLLRMLP